MTDNFILAIILIIILSRFLLVNHRIKGVNIKPISNQTMFENEGRKLERQYRTAVEPALYGTNA